ncbi:hypothetical protein EI94DRAFT_1726427 [Lactarius quietus]|nr:hypothetical protein EI94DRAFT_1726427 [Lactarius quietus]
MRAPTVPVAADDIGLGTYKETRSHMEFYSRSSIFLGSLGCECPNSEDDANRLSGVVGARVIIGMGNATFLNKPEIESAEEPACQLSTLITSNFIAMAIGRAGSCDVQPGSDPIGDHVGYAADSNHLGIGERAAELHESGLTTQKRSILYLLRSASLPDRNFQAGTWQLWKAEAEARSERR